MAVISGPTVGDFSAASVGTQINTVHDTFSSTELVLHFGAVEGLENLNASAPVLFASGVSASANATTIRDTGNTGSNTDVRLFAGGVIPSEAVTDANCRFKLEFDGAPAVSIWVNVSGVETASVAAATNYIGEAVIVEASSSATIASGGSTGNDLIVFAVAQGADMGAPTVTGFTDIVSDSTGAGTSDFYYYLGYKSAPGGASVDWLTSDESTAILIELVNSGGSPSVVALRRRRM